MEWESTQSPLIHYRKAGLCLGLRRRVLKAPKDNRKNPTLHKIIFRRQRPQERPNEGKSTLKTERDSPRALGTRLGVKEAGGAPSEARKVLPAEKKGKEDFPHHLEGRDTGGTGSPSPTPDTSCSQPFPLPSPAPGGLPGGRGVLR